MGRRATKSKAGPSPAKARKILHDKSVKGHPLTDRQRRFFGALSRGEKPRGRKR